MVFPVVEATVVVVGGTVYVPSGAGDIHLVVMSMVKIRFFKMKNKNISVGLTTHFFSSM